jgi:hypothetical protein
MAAPKDDVKYGLSRIPDFPSWESKIDRTTAGA